VNKQLVRRWIDDGFAAGNLALADELIALDFVNHTPQPGQPPGREGLSPGDMTVVDELVAPALNLHGAPADLPPGRDGLKALLGVFRAAFPDYPDTPDEMVADDDRVATRWTFRGTHRGHFQGIATTNKPVTISGMSIFRVSEGQIVEDWTEMDVLGLLQQIGPSPR
jgi:steroid delta-isomerase-like uncharacterized protein